MTPLENLFNIISGPGTDDDKVKKKEVESVKTVVRVTSSTSSSSVSSSVGRRKTKVKKSLVSESILRNIEEIKNGHMPFHAYKSLNVTESDHKINENKDEKNESSTDASKRSKRSNVEENEDEEEEQVPISFSDHEAVTSTMHIWASRSV